MGNTWYVATNQFTTGNARVTSIQERPNIQNRIDARGREQVPQVGRQDRNQVTGVLKPIGKTFLLSVVIIVAAIVARKILRPLIKCSELPDIEYGAPWKCSDGNLMGSICELDCTQNHIVKGDAKLECRSDGTWSSPPPSCTCDKCRIGDQCEDSTSWQTFKSHLTDSGGSNLRFAGNPIQCHNRGGLRGIKYQWTCNCVDNKTGHRVECSGWQSSYGSCEHASAELIRQLARKGIYPQPCDETTMATGC